ncbi:hypothetical protein [Streptomyces fagopyri]|uniref:hypothetical protein n=1 Tax=Streptomyces fagopyri TaxID=2662397 RepID=UPI0033D6FA82
MTGHVVVAGPDPGKGELLAPEAVDLAVAVREDLSDATAVAELTWQCEIDPRAMLVAARERADRLGEMRAIRRRTITVRPLVYAGRR